jgi:hypothetical protein
MTESTVATIDLTKAELTLQLSKEGLAYQDLLQQAENVVFTKDNLNEERTALISLRKVKSKLDAMENPHTKAWKGWNESRKSLVDPVAAVLQKKESEFRKLANEIAAENAKIEAEKQRKAGILAEIDSFFINQSQAIAAATTLEELVRIQKLIGSHKAAARYGEYLPLMVQKASNLEELIKVQKEAVKILSSLNRQEKAAEAIGDDETVLAMRELREGTMQVIEQTKIDVQESAINMATQADVVEPEVVVAEAPKARRTSWQWEMVDEKAATKANLTLVVPDEKKIGEILKEKRKLETECTENGIRYYQERSY